MHEPHDRHVAGIKGMFVNCKLIVAMIWLVSFAVGNVACANKAHAATADQSLSQQETQAMAHTAKGTFKVKLVRLAADAHGPEAPVGRMSIDKQFDGDMVGTSQGQMLMMRTAIEGSAAYVAIEVVTATLGDRSGSFALQHNGIMNRGVGTMSVTVVPDSGTDGLIGIAGELTINIVGGVHEYVFTYRLAEHP
jgi:Protein of unknown function (DUF3224)